jgi:hypothetical protein
MQNVGLVDNGGVHAQTHKFGPNCTIDWTNWEEVCYTIWLFGGAIAGVDAMPLDAALDAGSDASGWVCTAIGNAADEDHCIPIVGFGGYSAVAAMCGAPGTPPSGSVDPDGHYLLGYTWQTIGVIPWFIFQSMCGETHMVISDPDRVDGNPYAADYQEVLDISPPANPLGYCQILGKRHKLWSPAMRAHWARHNPAYVARRSGLLAPSAAG